MNLSPRAQVGLFAGELVADEISEWGSGLDFRMATQATRPRRL